MSADLMTFSPKQLSPKSAMKCVPSSPSKNSPKKARKRARFALGNNEVFPIPHLDDFSDEEIHEVYYEAEDYSEMKKEMVKVVQRMMKGEKIEETNSMTIRGLEFRTRKGALRRRYNKMEAITAVMDEQDKHFELNIYDEEAIARVYIEVNKHTLVEAQERAAEDEKAAFEHLKEASPASPRSVLDYNEVMARRSNQVDLLRSRARTSIRRMPQMALLVSNP